MIKLSFITTFLLLTTISFGQIQEKQVKETVTQFATRLKPKNSQLTFKVLDTKWNATPVIVTFYDQTYKLSKENDPGQDDYHRIIATILVQTKSNIFNKLIIDTIDSEGGDPEIKDVFFANVNKDTLRELIIIVSWEQRHYEVSGTLYQTFVYETPQTNNQLKLNFLKDISEKLGGGCECTWSNGKSKKAKFKTSKDVISELKKRGYKQ